jgi:ElaB/YqjD/DUF883 family membrane-anchored ribosome-binding protein
MILNLAAQRGGMFLNLGYSTLMDMATPLRNSANGYMAATLVKRVSTDVVRRVPYPAIGIAVILGAVAGVMLNRRRQGVRR